MHNCKGLSMG